MTNESQQVDPSSQVVVECKLCGTESVIPTQRWFVLCDNKYCQKEVLLAPVAEGKKYIRIICESVVQYARVDQNAATYTCGCGREHKISDYIAEIRSNQTAYNARHTVPLHQELKETKEKLKMTENEVEELRKRNKDMEEEINKTLRLSLEKAENECQRNQEELAELRSKKKAKEILNISLDQSFPWLLALVNFGALVMFFLFK